MSPRPLPASSGHPEQPLVGKLVVFGVGLIGASFAAALKRRGAVGQVTGVGRGRKNLDEALRRQAVDEVTDNAGQALAGADAVLLAVPVGQMATVLEGVARYLPAEAVLTDAGSTKRDVVAAARQALGGKFSRFVPAHPVAGAESSGAGAARAELFEGKKVFLTPVADTDPAAMTRVAALWEASGARVLSLSPEEHDDIFGAVSHLPHLLAYAFVDRLAAGPEGPRLFNFAGSGFRDFTRIAGSSPEMWRDVCLANRDVLLRRLQDYRGALAEAADLLERQDGAGLEALFVRAREARRRGLAEQE